uniref:C21orf2 n=1 Tax=Caligus clemensi TaxID=344056 RepID=C1C2I2_CALCM|nr:C21orf2 [Caligus clemensi]
MVKLTEEMIVARTRVSDMSSVTKLNCWGAELSGISIVRRLKNVEVLSLSVNNITSLSDIQHCSNLKELYIRKNKIQDLGEILWLRGLPSLMNLWLEENPCCGSYSEQYYRHTVIKALPQLRRLDNVEITPGEMVEAVSIGSELTHPLERDNNGYSNYNGSSSKSNMNGDSSRYYEEDRRPVNGYSDSRSHQRLRSSSIEQQQQYSSSPPRRNSNQGYDESISPQMSRMSVKPSRETSQESRSIVSHHYDQTYQQVNQQIESANQIISQRQITPERAYPRRPKNRNSNILSAVLCLIKELDGPSLEVAEMAVRCRMEELED